MPFAWEFRFLKVFAAAAWFFALASCGSEDEERDALGKESIGLLEKAMEGKQTLEDGSTYEGELSKGKPNGYGKSVSSGTFSRVFKNGLAHVYGTLINPMINRSLLGSWASGKSLEL